MVFEQKFAFSSVIFLFTRDNWSCFFDFYDGIFWNISDELEVSVC